MNSFLHSTYLFYVYKLWTEYTDNINHIIIKQDQLIPILQFTQTEATRKCFRGYKQMRRQIKLEMIELIEDIVMQEKNWNTYFQKQI